MTPELSICIPCYEMSGVGWQHLSESLSIIRSQECDLSQVEIVVSDHSIDDAVENICSDYNDLNIQYVRNLNGRGSMSINTNNCIRNSTGKYIKPLFQDDLFFNPKSLKHILDNLADPWMAHEYTHLDGTSGNYYRQRTPYINDNFISGINTLGPPSIICFINDGNFFDEELSYLMDTEFYHRMIIKYGNPTILQCNNPIGVVRTWSGQTTQTVTKYMIDTELDYIKYKKYEKYENI
jgi:glycosyltransferase involved in cell wall biosynthesis